MGKGKYITPVAIPVGTTGVCIQIPNSPVYRAALRAFLRDLSICTAWENVNGIAPEDAAAYAAIMWASFEANLEC